MEHRMTLRSVFVSLMLVALAGAQPRRIVAIAHRGEHLEHPENTLPAFQEAIRLGADFIEADVRTTSDGYLVLSHDETVDRCTNGHGKISGMTLAQVQALDAGGAKVPTFDQVLDLARGKIGIYVDVKSASAKDLVAHIDSHAMTDRVVIYCGLNLAKEIQQLNPKLKVMPEANSVEHASLLIDQLHPRVIAFGARDFKPEIISVVKKGGAAIYVDIMGATDTPEGWQAAIDAGADGLQTDRPGPLVEFLRRKGFR
jgi:glycerophosphoryl diester phosphodiesterase